MRHPGQKLRILVLDPAPGEYTDFYHPLGRLGRVDFYPSIAEITEAAAASGPEEHPAMLLDLDTLAAADKAQVQRVLSFRPGIPAGAVTATPPEEHLELLGNHGLLQTIVKTPPTNPGEAMHLVECVVDPASGFGLFSYLQNTIEMYNLSISTMAEKNRSVERVINHFATAGFDVHQLFDVRLILEEAINNAFYHAFRLPSGEKKYNPRTFQSLESQERIRIEYGTSAEGAGFTVSDNAGTLRPEVVLDRFYGQVRQTGTFDVHGRGLHLSRLLSSFYIINIEERKRTQIIALFDSRRRTSRPKPLMINFIGNRTGSLVWTPPERDMD